MWDHLEFLRPRVETTPPVDRALLRDLINCLEKGRPVDAEQLGPMLRRARAIDSYVNHD
jgi:hypothetical protein